MSNLLLDSFVRLLNPLKQRIMLMIARSIVGLVKDGESLQNIQITVLAGEIQTDVERFQNYGFTSHPLPGAEALVVYPGGDRDNGAAISVDDPRYRPTDVPAGGSAQYDATKRKAEFDGQGNWTVNPVLKSWLKSPNVELGSGSIREKILNGETFQTTYNAHTHSVFGVQSTTPVPLSLPTDLSLAVKAAKAVV